MEEWGLYWVVMHCFVVVDRLWVKCGNSVRKSGLNAKLFALELSHFTHQQFSRFTHTLVDTIRVILYDLNRMDDALYSFLCI